MRIRRVSIQNYRNLRNVDVSLGGLVTLVGENNSGKSNFLKAITLPLLSEEAAFRKDLSWYDINQEAKDDYYKFLTEHKEEIVTGETEIETLMQFVPEVSIMIELEAEPEEKYYIRTLCNEVRGNELVASIKYRYYIEDPKVLFDRIRELLSQTDEIDKIKMSLLPMEQYVHRIVVPGKECNVNYEILSFFRYIALPVERDSFAANSDKLGSHALIDIFRQAIKAQDLAAIEKKYVEFFTTIKESGKLEEVLNWQNYSDVPNAKQFFDNIAIRPNMPAISSILGSIKLGYKDDSLSYQGLGHRNLILMMVLLNSYLENRREIPFRLITVEEPEAHLCVNNILLMASFINIFSQKTGCSQLIYSTHNTEFVNKMGLDNVVVLHHGNAFCLKQELSDYERDYLTRHPNTDILNILFSRRVILVEGVTEELLIKSYLQTKPELNEIKVLSFHKGFKSIINIWKKANNGNGSKLGVIRDRDDNQEHAREEHESLQDEQVIVRTTEQYTLEPEIVETGDNCALLKREYGSIYGWTDKSKGQIQEDWRQRKTDVILRIIKDLASEKLSTFMMPRHIQEVIDFMQSEEITDSRENDAH